VVALGALAVMALSGGSSSDPRTPPALPGLPPPFQTAAVVGSGGLAAGLDAYGDIVELRAPGPAGRALIENPYERQLAGTVPAGTGIVPRVSVPGGARLPLWRADSVSQRYLPGTGVLRTSARIDGIRVRIDCAAGVGGLGCVGRTSEARASSLSFTRNLTGGGRLVHLDDPAARRIVAAEAISGRRWIARARVLGPGAPAWARAMYGRALFALRALADRRTGAVAAGVRDRWAYVWPRDAGAAAIALASAGYRPEARRVARFLLGLPLEAAARFDGRGEPVPGRGPQGDAAGWVAAAARAAGEPHPTPAGDRRIELDRYRWRGRPDYQEGPAGDYLGNALASSFGGPAARRAALRAFVKPGGLLVRDADDPGSGLDSAAAWAVRPFPLPGLFGAARRTMLRLVDGGGRLGVLPSQNWGHGEDPWIAPTAWTAWSLATLAGIERGRAAARDRAAALALLADLRRAATPAGLLPERVDARTGVPASTAPLAWSEAFAILAMRRLWP
jgi:hypothetical protein